MATRLSVQILWVCLVGHFVDDLLELGRRCALLSHTVQLVPLLTDRRVVKVVSLVHREVSHVCQIEQGA